MTLKLSAIDVLNSIYKCISRNFDIGGPRSGQFCGLSIRKLMLENWKASLSIENHLKHSSIGLQLELTSWIGIMRPVTPPHIAEVISAFQVIKGQQQFSRITFDRDRLEWCDVLDDKIDVLRSTIRIDWYAPWPFPIRSWPWPLAKLSKWHFKVKW